MDFCCVTWEGLAPELRASKEKELKKVVPQSLVFPLLKFLSEMHLCCPKCGKRLASGGHIPSTPSLKEERVDAPVANPTPKPRKCPDCKGAGYVGGDRELKCSTCLGQGVFNNNTVYTTQMKSKLPPPKIVLGEGEGIFIPKE